MCINYYAHILSFLMMPFFSLCQLFGWIGEKSKHQIVVFALMAIMAIQGVANLQAQWGIIGEFSNLPQEELLDWIQENTLPGGLRRRCFCSKEHSVRICVSQVTVTRRFAVIKCIEALQLSTVWR